MKHPRLATTIAACLVGISASASGEVVATASFESPVLNNGAIQYGPDEFIFNTDAVGPVVIPNFTFIGFSGIERNVTPYVTPTPFGAQIGFVQSFPSAGSEIVWNVSGLTPGATYRLTFDDIAFFVGAETLDVSAFGSSANFTPTSSSVYAPNSLTFTANATSGNISFLGLTSGGNFVTGIDNLVVSTVPEPAAWAMMLLGFGALGAAARGRRRQRALAPA